MWWLLALLVLVAVLLVHVWVRQCRHPVGPGGRCDPDAQIQAHGAFWGASPGMF